MLKKPIRIELISVVSYRWSALLNAELIDPHPFNGAKVGDRITTSPLRSIDFERGIAVTQNTIYIFEPENFNVG